MVQYFKKDFGLIGEYGAIPAIRPTQICDFNLEIPFRFPALDLLQISPPSVGVFCHIFYPGLSEEIRCHVDNIPVSFDLFISTDSLAKKSEIEGVFRDCKCKNLDVRVMPNIGRDIGPFLVGFREEILKYEILLHIHSKQSPHNSELAGWRKYAFEHLIGTTDTIASNILALTETNLGMIYPDHLRPVRKSLNFGYDFEQMKEILARADVEITKDVVLEFPSGSMFWAKSAALSKILDLDLQYNDFPPEGGQVDGTLAHAIERSFLYFVEKSGASWAKVSTASKKRNLPVYSIEGLKGAVNRLERRLTDNKYGLYGADTKFGEVSGLGVRPDFSPRPRITLLLPTLKPEKIFGGISSALRLFRQIMAELNESFDFRIVSLNDSVDLDGMGVVPDFQLVHMDSSSDCIANSVVDGSARSRSQIKIRANEFFLATAWWTADDAYRFATHQQELFSRKLPVIYLIQDHEPDFYGWSSKYALAQATYRGDDDTIAIVNSEELTEFMVGKYGFKDVYYIPYEINKKLANCLVPKIKERIILFYGRPQTPRNAFDLVVEGLCNWQQANPLVARKWKIVSAGETYDRGLVSRVSNIEIMGKLDLEDYADLLARASIGISLMLSPHPSYPPLEMAEAGLITITNSYENKNLELRSPNIRSVDRLTAGNLSKSIDAAVRGADDVIGHLGIRSPIANLDCDKSVFSPSKLAEKLRVLLSL
jgi:hypothetical protein